MDCYLPYFRQQFITHSLLSLLLIQPLFTESWHGNQLLAPPPFSVCFQQNSVPLLCVSFQFLVYCSVYFCVCVCGVSPPGVGGYAGLS
jgi:hypothetical protein